MIINVALDNVKKVSNKKDDFSRIQALYRIAFKDVSVFIIAGYVE